MIEKEKLVNIFGAANVSYEQTKLDQYSRDISFVNPLRPACLVMPANTDEIQKIVKLANETLTPLVPVSSGPPHFRGDTVPSAGGAVIVDLSRMNQIIRVDGDRRVCMVEPGVTFGELIPAVKKAGIRLNMPLLPRKSKTVVGSLLEREPVILPTYQWEISDPIACVGVVFGTGDDFRTGQAAGPGTLEEQWAAGAAQKAPLGPGMFFWHRLLQGAQGTMGIVTWASIRCEVLPKIEEPFFIGSPNLYKLLEVMHWLIRMRLVNECFILNRTSLATIMAAKSQANYQKLIGDLPLWTLLFNVAGYDYYPEERISYQIKSITKINTRVGVEATKTVAGLSASELLKTVQQPSDEPYWKLSKKGAYEDVFFLTTYDKIEGLIVSMNELAESLGYPASDMGIYLQPVVQGTSCHCEFNLFYDPDNQKECARIKELSTLAVRNLMDKGAFFSRPYGPTARMIMNRDAASISILNKTKKMFDPNNIMNPGKLCF